MQRRAAAAYAGLLILIAVGAYVMIGVAQEPAVTVANPDHSLGENETFEVGDRTYTVGEMGGSANPIERNTTLDWTNESERQTATLGNNSEFPVINATWSGQTARMTSTLANGSAVTYNGTAYTVRAGNGSFALHVRNVSFSVGDTFPYQGNRTTVTAVENENVTITWNTTRNETLTNGSTITYNGSESTLQVGTGQFDVTNDTFSVGDTFLYEGNRTNVTAADDGNVTLTWNTTRNATLPDGSNVSYNGTEYTLHVGAGEFTLTSDETVSFAVGDVLSYRGNRTTVTAVDGVNATLAWGDAYNVTTRTISNDTVTFRESFNVSAILRTDPAVENETTSINGTSHVVYTNDTVQPLTEYLPDPEVRNFTVGDSFRYDTPGSDFVYDDVSVDEVDGDGVVLSWRGPVPHEEPVEHGSNVTLGPDDQQFVAHFPDNDTLELTSDVENYQSQLALQDSFKNRTDGLWGIVILSGLAGVFLIGASYLPSRY